MRWCGRRISVPMLLETEGLEVRYGRTQAVRGVSLGVGPAGPVFGVEDSCGTLF